MTSGPPPVSLLFLWEVPARMAYICHQWPQRHTKASPQDTRAIDAILELLDPPSGDTLAILEKVPYVTLGDSPKTIPQALSLLRESLGKLKQGEPLEVKTAKYVWLVFVDISKQATPETLRKLTGPD